MTKKAKTTRTTSKPGGAAARRAPTAPRVRDGLPRGCPLSTDDLYLFAEGSHVRLHDKLGAQRGHAGRTAGVWFSVWAPHAERVSVVGGFNGWRPGRDRLERLGGSGVWSGFVPGVENGALYKLQVESADGLAVAKADPFAFRSETPPSTASRVWDLAYAWGDAEWLAGRAARQAPTAPMSIYEVHLGSWRRREGEPASWPTYRELAEWLPDYVADLGFTHVELLPPLEHPFYGSWGYQITGYFAATSRYGAPQDLMLLIDRLHRRGIGVVLDWVPSHFPSDEHGLARFDGTRLYEYPDPRLGYQPDWKSYVFNWGLPEVQSFLLSSALFWIERYHVDALRVDAVASMLYLDYSRAEGQWVRNKYGGRENLEAVAFLRRLNVEVHRWHPGVKTIAEESTAWPMVSRAEHLGGLGFDMKWDMGWMHDMLEYMRLDPIHRKFHHGKITFRMLYAFSENFVLPLSHDEVVHGKGSLLGKLPGDPWQRLAGLRLLFGYMWAMPGKKLLFMGGEIAQWAEWSHERALQWRLVDWPPHAGVQRWVADLNRAYRDEPALHRTDFDGRGFRWVDCNDTVQSVVSFLRHDPEGGLPILAVCNFTPVPREHYRVGVPADGAWREILNSDAAVYGGSGMGNLGVAAATPMRYHGLPYSLSLTLPPLGILLLRPAEAPRPGPPPPFADTSVFADDEPEPGTAPGVAGEAPTERRR